MGDAPFLHHLIMVKLAAGNPARKAGATDHTAYPPAWLRATDLQRSRGDYGATVSLRVVAISTDLIGRDRRILCYKTESIGVCGPITFELSLKRNVVFTPVFDGEELGYLE